MSHLRSYSIGFHWERIRASQLIELSHNLSRDIGDVLKIRSNRPKRSYLLLVGVAYRYIVHYPRTPPFDMQFMKNIPLANDILDAILPVPSLKVSTCNFSKFIPAPALNFTSKADEDDETYYALPYCASSLM